MTFVLLEMIISCDRWNPTVASPIIKAWWIFMRFNEILTDFRIDCSDNISLTSMVI
jgi:hypothetical protein